MLNLTDTQIKAMQNTAKTLFKIGVTIFALGIIWGYNALNMDVSVNNPASNLNVGQGIYTPERIVNSHLMQQQLILMLLSIGMTLSGLMFCGISAILTAGETIARANFSRDKEP